MSSRKKITANRLNAQKSTGPSLEARERTRFNGLKHGMRARTEILPCEDPLELVDLRETWFNCLKPRDAAEDQLVLDYVNACWMNLRAERALHEHSINHINQGINREDSKVGLDLRRLFWDKRGPHPMHGLSSACGGGPRATSPESPDDPHDPGDLLRGLESSANGCQALADCWRTLRERIEQGLEWQAHDRLKAVRMLGRNPIQIAEDKRIVQIYSGSFGLNPGDRTRPFDDLKTEMGTLDFEKFQDRIISRWPLVLDAGDKKACKATLFDLIDRNLERLESKLEVYRAMAEQIAAAKAATNAFDQSQDGERLRRHVEASERRKHRCLNAFWKQRRETRREEEYEAVDEGEIDGQEAEHAAAASVAEAAASGLNQNSTREAKRAHGPSEAEEMKEVTACVGEFDGAMDALIRLSLLRDAGQVAPAGGVSKGQAAIEEALFSGRNLLKPIS